MQGLKEYPTLITKDTFIWYFHNRKMGARIYHNSFLLGQEGEDGKNVSPFWTFYTKIKGSNFALYYWNKDWARFGAKALYHNSCSIPGEHRTIQKEFVTAKSHSEGSVGSISCLCLPRCRHKKDPEQMWTHVRNVCARIREQSEIEHEGWAKDLFKIKSPSFHKVLHC